MQPSSREIQGMNQSQRPVLAGGNGKSPWDLDSAAIPQDDQSAMLRDNHLSGGANSSASAVTVNSLLLQQQLLQSRVGRLRDGAGAGDSGLLGMSRSLGGRDDVVDASHNPEGDRSVQATQPRQRRARAPSGQATNPRSIAERLRKQRIAERMKALHELVPNANAKKTDQDSMLYEIMGYLKFLQLQVDVLSRRRLGSAAAEAPLVADMSSEVARLMEEDMGSALEYVNEKGLCLMPIFLATAISAATSSAGAGNPPIPYNCHNGGGPSSPSMSVFTAHPPPVGNGAAPSRTQPQSPSRDDAVNPTI